MINREGINYVLRNLNNRKTRTFLTSLSILIGIITIFIFISFGAGLYNYIDELSKGSAMDKVIIQQSGAGMVPGIGDFQLKDNDLRIIEQVPGVYEATGVTMEVAEIVQDNERVYTFLMGYDPKKPILLDVSNIKIDYGRMLQENEKKKVILGAGFFEDETIFSRGYRLNQKINIQGEELTIVGFFEEIGSPQDDASVYIPINYARELYPNSTGYSMIIARVDLDNMDSIIQKIEDSLRRERGLKKGEEDFYVQSFNDLIETYSGALNVVIGFIVLIALVSVLVSAINTSNTMITSVLERYKEIGVMKSIGAKNSEILFIFLFESSLIGFIAGSIGVLIGAGLSYTGGEILASLGWSFLKPLFSPGLFIGCILFATVTGGISGVLPALRASKINPVDALRYE